MAIELVLLEDVEGLGKIGDRVRVAEGYARNFLVRKKLATGITPDALRRLEVKKLKMQKEHEQRLAVAQALAEKIAQESLTIPMQAGDDNKLYGSVSANTILSALAESGIEIDRHAVVLPEPIKELGVYNVELQLHADVKASLKVWVVKG